MYIFIIYINNIYIFITSLSERSSHTYPTTSSNATRLKFLRIRRLLISWSNFSMGVTYPSVLFARILELTVFVTVLDIFAHDFKAQSDQFIHNHTRLRIGVSGRRQYCAKNFVMFVKFVMDMHL